MTPRVAHPISRFLCTLLLATWMLAAMPVTPAFAGDCDGTSGDDNIVCSVNPTNPDQSIALDDGNDTLVVNAGVFTGYIRGGLGDDHITINGNVGITVGVLPPIVEGDQGDDTIIVNGSVGHNVFGDDSAVGGTGKDTIVINGTISSVVAGGGDDVITVNGSVAYAVGNDGNDYIEVNGTVQASVEGDNGDDSVVLGANSSVAGTIDGGAGSDTLTFHALTQAQANALNPAGGTATVNGHTYTWLNFESLLGLLKELAEEAGRNLRVFFASDTLAAVESKDGNGVSFFAKPGRIAFVSFESLEGLDAGEGASYNTPNSAGWYVTVICLGADPDHLGHSLYQVHIFAPGGAAAGQFIFSN